MSNFPISEKDYAYIKDMAVFLDQFNPYVIHMNNTNSSIASVNPYGKTSKKLF